MHSCATRQECYKLALDVENAVDDSSIYSPALFPLTGTTEFLNVTMVVMIYRLLSLGNDKTLSIAMEMDFSWIDPNYPADWTGLPMGSLLYVDSSKIWTFNMNIMNPADENFYLRPDTLAFLQPPPDGSDGAFVSTVVIGKFVSSCDTMNLLDYPFDTQQCSMLLEYGDNSNLSFVLPATLQLSKDIDDSEWHVLNVTLTAAPTAFTSGSYAGVQLNLVLARKSYYYVLFLLVPLILLMSAGALTLVLPSDRGEKVVLGATLVVAMYVLFTTVSQQVPQISETSTPRLVIALEIGTLLNAFALFEAVVVQTMRILAYEFPDAMHDLFDVASRKRCAHNCKLIFCGLRGHDKDQKQTGNHDFTSRSSSAITPDLTGVSTDKNGNGNVSVVGSVSTWDDNNRSFDDSGMVAQFEIKPYVNQPQNATAESLLLRHLLEKWAHKKKLHKIEAVWRRVEYVINLISLAVYLGLMIYYYAFYIYLL